MTPKTQNIIAWILQGLVGLAFIGAGGGKLLNHGMTTQMFSSLGMPGWFGLFIGGAELLGGIGLLVPRFVRPAALGLIIIMIGAVFLHATKIPGGLLPATTDQGFQPNGLPSMVLLVLLVVIFWLRGRTPAMTPTVA